MIRGRCSKKSNRSVTKAKIPMHYNERDMFSPSIDMYENENKTKCLKWCTKK